jgi:epoxyqueuosine reductase
MKTAYQSPELNFAYRKPPISGNFLNGLGETEIRQARQIFHGSGFRKLEWEKLELFFLLTMPFSLFISGMLSRLQLRHADGKQAEQRSPVIDPAKSSERIKEVARKIGAGAVGITEITDTECYQDYKPNYKYAISIAYPMNFEIMKENVTYLKGGLETIRAYTEITRIVIELAKHIRAMGWPARAYCESADILQIPLAIKAGVGELGKHGSLINRELGSDLRLATVLTDLPMALDQAVDIGVEDLCAGCRRCTADCPVDAISDDKQMVRGINKWYVDFDKCVPYFSKTYGCGICIQVCPWSKPGRGPSLSQSLLSKR